MGPSVTDWIQAAASLLTMLAACAALIVAAKAPRLAAKFAEEYRRQSAAEEDRQKLRLGVFSALMKHRSEILAPDARAAINLIDVAFADQPEVRNARRLFIEASLGEPTNPTTIVERYHAMIEAAARAVNLSETITGFDVRSGYYPDAIARLDAAALADAEEKLARRAAEEALKTPNRSALDAYRTRRD